MLDMFTLFKGKGSVPQQPMVTPEPPVEEASVDIGDESIDKKKTGKASLKIPLADTTNTGLKV